MEKNYENLKKLFEEHETMFFAYQDNVTRPKEAKFHLERCKDILEKIHKFLGENCSLEKKSYLAVKIIQNLRNFGDWFEAIGNLKSSEQNFNMAIMKIEEYRVEIEPHLTNKEKNKKAEEYYLKSLKIRQSLLGENHCDVATSLNDLGGLYKNMGNLPKAEEYYLKSLKIRQNLFGEDHCDVAMSLHNLGCFYDNMGNLPKAEEFYLKSLKIRQTLSGNSFCGKT